MDDETEGALPVAETEGFGATTRRREFWRRCATCWIYNPVSRMRKDRFGKWVCRKCYDPESPGERTREAEVNRRRCAAGEKRRFQP